MKVIKLLSAALAAATALTTLDGCAFWEQFIGPDPLYDNRYELDKNLTDEIIAHLNEGDRLALRDKFSDYCINYMADFDSRIDELFTLTGGNILSYTYDAGLDDKAWDYGTSYRHLDYDVALTTETGTVYMTVAWYPINEYDGAYEGICFMYAGENEMREEMPGRVTEADGTEHNVYETMEFGLYFGGENFYRPDQKEMISRYTDAVYASYVAGNANLLAEQFCRAARADIVDDIERLFEYIPSAENVKEQPYETDSEGNRDFPSPTAKRYKLEIADGVVKEYWFGYADLEDDDYNLAFIYCLRDDTAADRVGLNGILFYPRAAYDDIDADSLSDFECGIYLGDQTKSFRTAD